jgi:hypothetical protein
VSEQLLVVEDAPEVVALLLCELKAARRAGRRRGYSVPGIRRWLRVRRIRAVIPTRRDQHPLRTFDHAAYRQRAVIGQRVGWLKERRRIAARFEKVAVHLLGVLDLAVLQLCLRISFANTA